MRTYEDQASSDRSQAALRARLTNPLQEVLDVKCRGRPSKDLGPYANVGVSTSLPDLEVEVAANVWASTGCGCPR